ncbi:MAG: hypothetical protein KGL25_08255 [Gammaproteobacteria bacterium]|nr:hypothetical protein [Gammaproteobacteria bacterium]
MAWMSIGMNSSRARAGEHWRAGIAGALLLAAAIPAMATAAPEVTAAQIIQKNAVARGGIEAWRKVQTMVWLGHIVSDHAALPSMPFVMEQKRPNKTHFEIHVMNQTTERLFDGAQGWKVHADQGNRPAVEPFSIQELRFAQSALGIDGPLMAAAAKGYAVTLVGVDQIEGHKTYRLDIRLPSGETDHVWVDATTFLEVRYDRPSDGVLGAARSVSVVYGDYRSYEGLQLPSVIETGVGPGSTPDRMMIERVVLNPPLDDDRFSHPGQSRRYRPGQLGGATASKTR